MFKEGIPMKKLLVFLLGIMVMAAVTAGCGGDNKSDGKPAAQKFILLQPLTI